MNRLDRLTAILTQLQGKRTVRAQEIADRFGISLRTVYRDVHSLQTGGVPIIGEAGVGYSIMEGFRLPPVQFTRDEAGAFLTAGKLIEKFGGCAETHHKTGMEKIRAVLRLSEKDFLENLDGAVKIHKTGRNAPELAQNNVLPIILQAIAAREAVRMDYLGSQDEVPVARVVEPMGVFFKNEFWYLLAFCRLRQDVRNFRLDRAQNLRATGQFFEFRPFDLDDFLIETGRGGQLFSAKITVENDVLRFIGGQKTGQGFVSEKTSGGLTEMRFETPNIEFLARWMMQFADKIVAIEPPALEASFRRILESATGNFSKKA